MIRVGIVGGRGHVGQELIGILLGCSEYEIIFVGSSSMAGKPIADEYSDLPDNDLVFQDLESYVQFDEQVDVWVLAQPNGCAQAIVDNLNAEARVIDISSDFRFNDDWVYGLAERNAQSISTARRIANPGCYATGTQLGLLPILDRLAAAPSVFGLSGYSGAGKKPNERNQPDRLKDNLLPYQLTDHTHEKEITYQLGRPVHFMPHVGSFFRGISLTISVQLNKPSDAGMLQQDFEAYYANSPHVEIRKDIPEIQDVADTNQCLIGGISVSQSDPTHVVLVSVLDNLRKGAASQVMQNLNLMFSLDQSTGL